MEPLIRPSVSIGMYLPLVGWSDAYSYVGRYILSLLPFGTMSERCVSLSLTFDLSILLSFFSLIFFKYVGHHDRKVDS